MRLRNILVIVKDIERSIRFYHDLFGLDIVLGNDGNIILTEGLVLQDEKIWKVPVIQKSRIKYRTILRHLIQLCKCVYKPSDEMSDSIAGKYRIVNLATFLIFMSVHFLRM